MPNSCVLDVPRPVTRTGSALLLADPEARPHLSRTAVERT